MVLAYTTGAEKIQWGQDGLFSEQYWENWMLRPEERDWITFLHLTENF